MADVSIAPSAGVVKFASYLNTYGTRSLRFTVPDVDANNTSESTVTIDVQNVPRAPTSDINEPAGM